MINGKQLSESVFRRRGEKWSAVRLYQYAKEQGYETFELELRGIDIGIDVWSIKTMKELIEHIDRINACSLKHPILLDDEGFICDGWHRLVKAITTGKKTITAIKIEEMPPVDSYEDNT